MGRRQFALILVVLLVVLTPASNVRAKWTSIDDQAFKAEQACRNGFSFGLASDRSSIYTEAFISTTQEIVFQQTIGLSSLPITTGMPTFNPQRGHWQRMSGFFAMPWTKELAVGTKVVVRWPGSSFTSAVVTVEDCFLPDLSSTSSAARVVGADNRLAYNTTFTNAFPATLATTMRTEDFVCDRCPILIPKSGAAKSQYDADQQSVFVRGLQGTITNVTVLLPGLYHDHADDLDIWLEGPNKQLVMLMSDTGGSGALNGVNLTFDDGAAAILPDEVPITSGTYRPSNYQGSNGSTDDAYTQYNVTLASFNGLDPTGQWRLLIVNDAPDRGGPYTVVGRIEKWGLRITTKTPAATVVDTLPNNTTFVSAGGNGWICGHASRAITCTRESLPLQAPPFEVVVQAADTTTPIAHTASVIASNRDMNPSNNTTTHTISVAPFIITQPASTTVKAGQVVTLRVAGTGTAPLSYQWYRGTSGDTHDSIAGATSSTYTTPELRTTTNYWARVSNGVGTADSATATITVQVVDKYKEYMPMIVVPLAVGVAATNSAMGLVMTYSR